MVAFLYVFWCFSGMFTRFHRIALHSSLTTIFPLVIYNVIFNAIVPNGLRDRIDTDRNEFGATVSRQDRLRDEEDWDKYLYRARGISLGIEVGLVLMLWGPLIFWKRMVSVIRILNTPVDFDMSFFQS